MSKPTRHCARRINKGRTVRLVVPDSGASAHSTIAMTMDTYSHVTPTMQRDAVAAMHRALGGGA